MILNKGRGILKEIIRNRVLYLMFLPVALYYILFSYLPMGGIIIAFKEFNYGGGILFSPWNGLENFRFFFTSGKAFTVILNTLGYNLLFLTCYTLFSIITAIMISEMTSKWFKKLSQSFMFLPYFISWVVASEFVYNFFNYEFGTVNALLKSFGKQPIEVYSNPHYWYILLPLLYIWKWVGFGSILYLAAIMGIDQECYEAAKIDGANMIQKIFSITLPMIKPTIVILVLLSVGRVMRGEFDMFYNLIGNNGILMNSTDIIDTLVFRSLMGSSDFGMAAAAGFIQSVLCFVIILIVNGTVKKLEPDYALF